MGVWTGALHLKLTTVV